MKEMFDAVFSDSYVLGWTTAFIICLIAEGATFHALVTIWFAIGALAATLAALAGLGFIWQLSIFVAVSALLLILTRPLVRRLRRNAAPDPTEEYDIGKTAIVIEGIDNELGVGRVKLDGVDWAARSADGGSITEGAVVTVRKIDGAKLIVTR